jgi:hypothetical protein
MTKHDMARLAQFLSVLGEAFNETVSELRAEAYFLALEDLPIEAIEGAGRMALNCQYFPRPHEIRSLAVGSTEDGAELAWACVLREVRRVGAWGTPTLPDDVADAVRAVWGPWQTLCATLPGEGPELLGWRKAFLAAFVAGERSTQRQIGPSRDEAKQLLGQVLSRR